MPRFFVKVVEFIPAAKSSKIVVPKGAADPREQNMVVLRRSKGGSTITVPVGDRTLYPGQKLQVKTVGERVMLLPR